MFVSCSIILTALAAAGIVDARAAGLAPERRQVASSNSTSTSTSTPSNIKFTYTNSTLSSVLGHGFSMEPILVDTKLFKGALAATKNFLTVASPANNNLASPVQNLTFSDKDSRLVFAVFPKNGTYIKLQTLADLVTQLSTQIPTGTNTTNTINSVLYNDQLGNFADCFFYPMAGYDNTNNAYSYSTALNNTLNTAPSSGNASTSVVLLNNAPINGSYPIDSSFALSSSDYGSSGYDGQADTNNDFGNDGYDTFDDEESPADVVATKYIDVPGTNATLSLRLYRDSANNLRVAPASVLLSAINTASNSLLAATWATYSSYPAGKAPSFLPDGFPLKAIPSGYSVYPNNIQASFDIWSTPSDTSNIAKTLSAIRTSGNYLAKLRAVQYLVQSTLVSDVLNSVDDSYLYAVQGDILETSSTGVASNSSAVLGRWRLVAGDRSWSL